jgi:hypothetical protein
VSGTNSPVPARLKTLNDGRIRGCCGRSTPDCPGELGYVVTELKLQEADGLPFQSEREWWQQQEDMAQRSLKRTADPLDPPEVSLRRYQMTQPYSLMETLGEVHGSEPGEWVITHLAGLQSTGDGAFAVIRGRRAEDGTRVGRRRVPDQLVVSSLNRSPPTPAGS